MIGVMARLFLLRVNFQARGARELDEGDGTGLATSATYFGEEKRWSLSHRLRLAKFLRGSAAFEPSRRVKAPAACSGGQYAHGKTDATGRYM